MTKYFPLIKDLNHVALLVADLRASMAYYERLGLMPIRRPAFDFEGAWFRLGTAQELHLIAGRAEPVQSAKRGAHFAMQVTDLVATAQWLESRQIAYTGPYDRPDGARQLFLTDPDGYVFEFCELA